MNILHHQHKQYILKEKNGMPLIVSLISYIFDTNCLWQDKEKRFVYREISGKDRELFQILTKSHSNTFK
jgi:hypothetical protein